MTTSVLSAIAVEILHTQRFYTARNKIAASKQHYDDDDDDDDARPGPDEYPPRAPAALFHVLGACFGTVCL